MAATPWVLLQVKRNLKYTMFLIPTVWSRSDIDGGTKGVWLKEYRFIVDSGLRYIRELIYISICLFSLITFNSEFGTNFSLFHTLNPNNENL